MPKRPVEPLSPSTTILRKDWDAHKPIKTDKPFECGVVGCVYKCKRYEHLKRHKAAIHDIDVKWLYCCVDGCDFKCKDAVGLKRHKTAIHDIDVKWFYCCVDDCDFKCKQSANLKAHKAAIHDIDVKWFYCDVDGCDFKFKKAAHLKGHKAAIHDIDVKWFCCDVDGCGYKCKQAGSLTTHKTLIHDIDVKWFYCDVDGCDLKFKKAAHLKGHKAAIHDIDVKWFCCDVDGCGYKCKVPGSLKEHLKSRHNPVYVARKKQQEDRIRKALCDAGYTEWFQTETMPPIGFFKREKKIDFSCASVQSDKGFCRIDFVIAVGGGFVFLEVDEEQHKYGYDGMVSCDMKRMSHCMESMAMELGDSLPYIYWLRYNPHAWRVDGNLRSVKKDDREAALLRWLSGFEPVQPLQIGYAFYDCEGDGSLDVLANEEYNAHYAEVVENLWDFSSEDSVCMECDD